MALRTTYARSFPRELSKIFSGDDAKFTLPLEIASLKPRFTVAEIRDVGDGTGELFIEAEAPIAASDMTKLLSLIAKPN